LRAQLYRVNMPVKLKPSFFKQVIKGKLRILEDKIQINKIPGARLLADGKDFIDRDIHQAVNTKSPEMFWFVQCFKRKIGEFYFEDPRAAYVQEK